MVNKYPISVFRQLYYIGALNEQRKKNWISCEGSLEVVSYMRMRVSAFAKKRNPVLCLSQTAVDMATRKGLPYVLFSPDLYSFSTQTFVRAGFVEKFGVLTICHFSNILHILIMWRMQKYIPVPFKERQMYTTMLSLI
jgi:hypothetical protein